MVSIRNSIISYLLGILVATVFTVACSPQATMEDGPADSPTSTLRSEEPPKPITLEPTYTSNPPTNTPPATTIPTAPQTEFLLCDHPLDGEAMEGRPAQQEGLPVEVDSAIPPAPPARVSFTISEERVVVTWQGTGTDVDQSYNIYQLEVGDACWELLGTKPVEGDNKGIYTFDAPISGQPEAIFYAVSTIDIYENESDLSIAGEPEPTS